MHIAIKVVALVLGLIMATGGSVMFVLAIFFGSGGIMDRYRRDRASEAIFAVIALVGCGLLGWATLS